MRRSCLDIKGTRGGAKENVVGLLPDSTDEFHTECEVSSLCLCCTWALLGPRIDATECWSQVVVGWRRHGAAPRVAAGPVAAVSLAIASRFQQRRVL